MTPVVVGDVMLDRDLDGRAERLSPDAPVPVVDEVREHTRPGGAGLAAGALRSEAVEAGVATAAAFVQRGAASTVSSPDSSRTDSGLVAATRDAGRTVVLPYLPGRSTTGILARRP